MSYKSKLKRTDAHQIKMERKALRREAMTKQIQAARAKSGNYSDLIVFFRHVAKPNQR